MSFKREGDDYSALNILKKRRVAELLANDIPDDEAILMANGRYACTVCNYRPVFDTVDMLTVHRKGKKHASYLQRHYRNQRELTELKIKRVQSEYLKREESRNKGKGDGTSTNQTAPLLTETQRITQNALRKAVPYNSCVKWGRKKPSDTGAQGAGSEKKLFFQSNKPPSEPRKSFGGVPGAYVPKRIRNISHNTPSSSASPSREYATSNAREGDEDDIKKITSNIPKDTSFISPGQITTLMRPPPPPPSSTTSCTASSSVAMTTASSVAMATTSVTMTTASSVAMARTSALVSPPGESSVGCNDPADKSDISEHLNNDDVEETLNNDQSKEKERRKAEVLYYVKMKSDGWIKDHRTGKWVRDENVEFDSDDEPPSPP